MTIPLQYVSSFRKAGFFDIEAEPNTVNCAHDNVEVGDVKVDLNLKGVK
jgi:hypothetical protein